MSRPLRSGYLPNVQRTRRSERGIVLAIVLVMIFALVTAVYAFQHRAIIDNTIAANRLESAEADALAKGGLRLAEVIVMIVRAKYVQGDAGSSGLGEQDLPGKSNTTPELSLGNVEGGEAAAADAYGKASAALRSTSMTSGDSESTLKTKAPSLTSMRSFLRGPRGRLRRRCW